MTYIEFDGIDLSGYVAHAELDALPDVSALIADLPDASITLQGCWIAAELLIGCSHPTRYEITALADRAERWRCDGCGAEWSTIRDCR